MSHKNDPDYHDQRAKILLEAANHIKQMSKETSQSGDFASGLAEAGTELRRMATNARRQHKKVLDRKRQQGRDSDARAAAFGYGTGTNYPQPQ
jgi:hypothetical protein